MEILMVQQEDRFLLKTEIRDDNALRADDEKLRVAYELQRDIVLELNIDHKSSLPIFVVSHPFAKKWRCSSIPFRADSPGDDSP